MMNFKKNQNNAVCSMDCKNCPHGASQPNPMDDPMFEKSIAMLHNWLMLEAIREDHPKERIVMVILPGAGGELLTEDGSRDIFEDVYDEMEADLVADGELLLHYDKSDVIETDRTRYLLGAAEVSEIDQNGNEWGGCRLPIKKWKMLPESVAAMTSSWAWSMGMTRLWAVQAATYRVVSDSELPSPELC